MGSCSPHVYVENFGFWAVSLCLTIWSLLDNLTDLFLFQLCSDFSDDNWVFS